VKTPVPPPRPEIELPDEDGSFEVVGAYQDPRAEDLFAVNAQPPARPPEAPRARRPRVLVADDDPAIRRIARDVLAPAGCDVIEAGNGAAALDAARAHRPDLAIVDAMMPGMHGFDLCRALRADPLLESVRIVLCSAAYRGPASADARAMLRADAVLDKPFHVDELRRTVTGLLFGEGEGDGARALADAAWRAGAEALAEGRHDDAVRLARSALAHDPGCAEAHYYLGHALARAGSPWEAMPALERAAELRPEVALFHVCLAELCERLGFLRSARAAWVRAAEAATEPAERRGCEQRLLRLLRAR
jgi:CheY-like chemotaxis protein